MKGRSNLNPTTKFCALEYSTSDVRSPTLDDAQVIAFVTLFGEDDLEIRVHPEWETMVNPRDRAYLAALYRDLKERTGMDPQALFRQFSALDVGPLITYEVGSDLHERPEYIGLLASFREL